MEEKNNHEENTNIGDFKIWIGDDGIGRLKIEPSFLKNQLEVAKKDEAYRSILEVIEGIKKVIKDLSARPRFLITFPRFNMGIPNLEYRKNLAEIAKKAAKEINPERVAIYGGGVIQRVTFSFLIKFTKLDNIVKYFNTEEEALKWLKED